jgi:hypothetical protein
MRIAPRTPKAGSSFVASTIGVRVGEGEEEVVTEAEEGVRVRVTFKVVGRTVVIGTFWPWDWMEEVSVTELVVKTKETF